ncbi:hypothetical protein SAMN05428985_104230 [Nocardioides sp. YR527]|nr:hypothetical protein SAMN05428985_104230 [Nocardioides sp. YR527]
MLGLDLAEMSTLLVETAQEHHLLVEVSTDSVDAWATRLGVPVRRCYFADEHLEARAAAGIDAGALAGTYVPDNPSVMSGDFGEMLAAFYLASKQAEAIDPLKWRFKNDRNQSAPKSDVVRFSLPTWPAASGEDRIECAEVKSKASRGNSKPIASALKDSATDRGGRLDKTLNWLKELAIKGELTQLTVEQLERFITPTDSVHGPYSRDFKAIAVIDAKYVATETENIPGVPDQCTLIVLSVTDLMQIYTATFTEVVTSAETHVSALGATQGGAS